MKVSLSQFVVGLELRLAVLIQAKVGFVIV